MKDIRALLGIKNKGANKVVEPKPKPERKLLRNMTGKRDIVGGVALEPSGPRSEDWFDVEPGGIVEEKMKLGDLVEVNQKVEIPPVYNLPPAESTKSEVPPLEVGHYKCAWCDMSTNTAGMAREHIEEAHFPKVLEGAVTELSDFSGQLTAEVSEESVEKIVRAVKSTKAKNITVKVDISSKNLAQIANVVQAEVKKFALGRSM